MNKIKKKLISIFYNYDKYRRAVTVSAEDFATINFATDYSKPAVQSSPSSSKELQLCALLDRVSKEYRCCLVVEKTIEHFEFDDKKNIVYQKFFQKKSWRRIAYTLNISDSTYWRWLNEILDVAEKWAREFKVLGD